MFRRWQIPPFCVCSGGGGDDDDGGQVITSAALGLVRSVGR